MEFWDEMMSVLGNGVKSVGNTMGVAQSTQLRPNLGLQDPETGTHAGVNEWYSYPIAALQGLPLMLSPALRKALVGPQYAESDIKLPLTDLRPSQRNPIPDEDLRWHSSMNQLPDYLYPSNDMRSYDLSQVQPGKGKKFEIGNDYKGYKHNYLFATPQEVNTNYPEFDPNKNALFTALSRIFNSGSAEGRDAPTAAVGIGGSIQTSVGKDQNGQYYVSLYDKHDAGGSGGASGLVPEIAYETKHFINMMGGSPYYTYDRIPFTPDTTSDGKLVLPKVLDVKSNKYSKGELAARTNPKLVDMYKAVGEEPTFTMKAPKEWDTKKKQINILGGENPYRVPAPFIMGF